MSEQATASPYRRPPVRCGMCTGRISLDRDLHGRWVRCDRCAWSSGGPDHGTLAHRVRLVLAVPGWTWWSIHGPAGRLFGLEYRLRARLLHGFGWHTWGRSPWDGRRRCTWCGTRR